MEQAEIGSRGEEIVGEYLRDQGLTVTVNTALPGPADIQAVGLGGVSYLVQVKTAMYPNKPEDMQAQDKVTLRARAQNLGYEAQIAQVVIDAQGNLQGAIAWSNP